MNTTIAACSAVATVLVSLAVYSSATAPEASLRRVPVVFSGGHDTFDEDRGRPVVLIAGALGVPPEVFREAFSHVHPAPAGTRPDPQDVRANKDALLSRLEPYGVTNDRLDEVSNYYRYVRSRREIWPNQPAVANALVKDGKLVGFEIVRGGSGYTTAPDVKVPGFKSCVVSVKLAFGPDFDHNGSVSSMKTEAKHK